MKKSKSNERLDYVQLAENFSNFKTPEEKKEAELKVEDYLLKLIEHDQEYTAELIRRIQSDKVLHEQFLNSVLHLSLLLTSCIIEDLFKYDIVFDLIKKKSKNDYEDTKRFKLFLLNEDFSLKIIQDELGFTFSEATLNKFMERFSEIKYFFNNY